MEAVKLFGKWDSNIEVNDPGLKKYLNLEPIILPRTGGRHTKVRFHKSRNPIVERLINKIMVSGHKGKKHKLSSGHNTGKALKAYNIVKKAFEIIEKELNKNPVEVFVRALENSTPREEITTIEYGGARYPQAVDCSPQRRLDVSLRMMVQGAHAKSFSSKKSIERCLADEIILAYNKDNTSNAMGKRLELERQADSAR